MENFLTGASGDLSPDLATIFVNSDQLSSTLEINISRVLSTLTTYLPEIRMRALDAIICASVSTRRAMAWSTEDTGWYQIRREDDFFIECETADSRVDILNISTESTPLADQPGAFFVRRNGEKRYLRIRGKGDGPSAIIFVEDQPASGMTAVDGDTIVTTDADWCRVNFTSNGTTHVFPLQAGAAPVAANATCSSAEASRAMTPISFAYTGVPNAQITVVSGACVILGALSATREGLGSTGIVGATLHSAGDLAVDLVAGDGTSIDHFAVPWGDFAVVVDTVIGGGGDSRGRRTPMQSHSGGLLNKPQEFGDKTVPNGGSTAIVTTAPKRREGIIVLGIEAGASVNMHLNALSECVRAIVQLALGS